MSIDHLPEELLLYIFSYLDSPAPSILKNRQEPSLQLTSSDSHILKNISLVSHKWRRIILPLLFNYARLTLDDVSPFEDPTGVTREGNEDVKGKAIKADGNTPAFTIHAGLDCSECDDVQASHRIGHFPLSTITWAQRVYNSLHAFLQSVSHHNLASSISSFTLCSSHQIWPERYNGAGRQSYRFHTASAFWDHLITVVEPMRVVIVAPPVEMACWTGCEIDRQGEWAFEDMYFHILELGQESRGRGDSKGLEMAGRASMELDMGDSNDATEPSRNEDTSILTLRPWTRMGLNEGSFLRAYGTWEFFERGPPSLIYSIMGLLASTPPPQQLSTPPQPAYSLSSLRSFTYTAILPFSTHVNFSRLLPYLDELDVKLAPDPESGILQDSARVGKAELGDCWQEFFASYERITMPLRTGQLGVAGEAKAPKLRKFVCRDYQIQGLVLELDDEFTPLCLPCWQEPEPGVFERLALVPPVYHDEW